MEQQREKISTVQSDSPEWISTVHLDANPEAGDGSGDDSDFEFVPRDPDSGVEITADEIFSNGRIRPAYPLFGRALSPSAATSVAAAAASNSEPSIPIHKLAIEDPDSVVGSTSSSDCDELEPLPGGSYAMLSPERQRRSASAGVTQRARIRDLVEERSRSDGNKKFMFLARPSRMPEKEKDNRVNSNSNPKKGSEQKGKGGKVTEMDMATAHRLYYSKKGVEGAVNNGKRSFLPYRADLVGFFGNAAHRMHNPF